jgi:O-methyltransferase
MLNRAGPFRKSRRDFGIDWPAEAETMIGMQRLTSLQHCVVTVVECGVWRGRACILMRAVLAADGDETRCVWLADSLAGLPHPDTASWRPYRIRSGLAKRVINGFWFWLAVRS